MDKIGGRAHPRDQVSLSLGGASWVAHGAKRSDRVILYCQEID